jgi:hypothetical protein
MPINLINKDNSVGPWLSIGLGARQAGCKGLEDVTHATAHPGGRKLAVCCTSSKEPVQ